MWFIWLVQILLFLSGATIFVYYMIRMITDKYDSDGELFVGLGLGLILSIGVFLWWIFDHSLFMFIIERIR